MKFIAKCLEKDKYGTVQLIFRLDKKDKFIVISLELILDADKQFGQRRMTNDWLRYRKKLDV